MPATQAPASPSPSRPFITPRDVATIFHVSLPTVSKWRRSGLLPSVRINSRLHRFDPADVERLRTELRGQQG